MSDLKNAELFDESESNPFNVDDYIERLAWRTRASNDNNFDPQVLYDEFVAHIQELRLLDDRLQRKSVKLESELRKEGKKHAERIQELQRSQQTAFSSFQELEKRISDVAARVVHLGEQLEGVNTPREHAFDAQKLMGYFSEFLEGEPVSDVLVNPSMLNETADIIRKLYLIAQELPESQFEAVKMRITEKYKKTEKELLLKFRDASQENNVEQMQQMAETLSSYQHYTHCVDAFIEQAVHQLVEQGMNDDIFSQVEDLIGHVSPQISQVFNSPEQVTAKLIHSCYDEQIQEYIRFKLNPMKKTDISLYLREAMRLFQQTTKLSEKLSKYRPGSDSTFTKKLQREIFKPFTSSYIQDEETCIRNSTKKMLDKYYESINHEKRGLGSEALTKIGSLFGSDAKKIEILISQELATEILDETANGFKRCGQLSPANEAPQNSLKIFGLLIDSLMKQHLLYAVELALSQAPSADPRTEPDLSLFEMVSEANTVWHLFEKQFNDELLPLTATSPKHSDAVQARKAIKENLEEKLDQSLDKTITSAVGYCKYILAAEQKKNDFLSEDLNSLAQSSTPACRKVVDYLGRCISQMKSSLDGENIDIILSEFGCKFHALIFDHLQQFQYSSMGGMLAICDIKEYRTAAKSLGALVVDSEFDILHALCNLLVVVPENLRQVCTGDQLANIDKLTLHNFVKLRVDYRQSNLQRLFT